MFLLNRTILKFCLICLMFIYGVNSFAQVSDSVYNNNIKTVQLYGFRDQLSFPAINLNSGDQLELHFDDLQADVKYYYYTIQLCNFDWTIANLSEFDYLRGFTQLRINTYRNSSIAYTRYTHYQATLPDRNMMPTKSGNYIVKVFLDGDVTKVIFTRRMVVVENKSIIKAHIVQPYNAQHFRTHQRVQFGININGLDAFNANQQIKVIILQNGRWDNAVNSIQPSFIRGNSLEFNTEDNLVFAGGKEWRWLDIRDFHLQSDRVEKAEYGKRSTEIFVRPDVDRSNQRYVYYRDRNGKYSIENTINLNPFWQGDYATVHFAFVPPGKIAYPDSELYMAGQLTDYHLNDSSKMTFNAEKGQYEGHLFLKEGYYDYNYILQDKNSGIKQELDGNYFETENDYTILVYFKSFTDRSDELIGISRINSRTDNPGFSF